MKIPNLRHSAEQVGGIVFFGRMLDKIRLHAQGLLPGDYNRGTGFDGRVCRFLRVGYRAVVERVLAGGSDEEILAWCFDQGRRPGEEEILMFNSFLARRGWRDDTTGELEEMKRERGFAGRVDIQTFFDFHKADEEPEERINDVRFSFAIGSDWTAIQSLLADCRLPADGVEVILDNCIVARVESRVVGTVALEPRGPSALLRSLAVAPECRGRSLGRELMARMLNHARLLGVERLYLLTTDADGYFGALGFKRIERSEAPAQIQATAQFGSLCPQSAVCMARDISGDVIHASAELLRLRPDVPGARMWAVSLEHTMLTYFEVAPRSRFESHSHDSEQITMVLTGELFFEVQGAVHCIRPGEVIAIPSSVPHAVWTEELAVTAIDAWSPVMKKYGSLNA